MPHLILKGSVLTLAAHLLSSYKCLFWPWLFTSCNPIYPQTPTFLCSSVHAENGSTEVLLGWSLWSISVHPPGFLSRRYPSPGWIPSIILPELVDIDITSKILPRMWASKHRSHPDAGDKRRVDGCRNGAIVKTSWAWGVTKFCRASSSWKSSLGQWQYHKFSILQDCCEHTHD